MTDKIDVSEGRSNKFRAAAKELSNYLASLDNLSTEENDKLIDLICDQVMAAERDAFTFGFKTCLLMDAGAPTGRLN